MDNMYYGAAIAEGVQDEQGIWNTGRFTYDDFAKQTQVIAHLSIRYAQCSRYFRLYVMNGNDFMKEYSDDNWWELQDNMERDIPAAHRKAYTYVMQIEWKPYNLLRYELNLERDDDQDLFNI